MEDRDMGRKTFTAEQGIFKLREVEVMVGQGASIAEALPPVLVCALRAQQREPQTNATPKVAFGQGLPQKEEEYLYAWSSRLYCKMFSKKFLAS